ncbi:hypothetical protein HDE_11034 [Halotydeus destructor]|nr:hypothetical protein HDE_11034 [Halotydeus destructor]
MNTLTALVVLGLVASAMSLCRHPEDADSSCTSDCDCCGGAVCRPGPADISGECGLFCCYDSGSVATDSELCCNPCGTTEICDCGIWACAPWGSTGFAQSRGKKLLMTCPPVAKSAFTVRSENMRRFILTSILTAILVLSCSKNSFNNEINSSGCDSCDCSHCLEHIFDRMCSSSLAEQSRTVQCLIVTAYYAFQDWDNLWASLAAIFKPASTAPDELARGMCKSWATDKPKCKSVNHFTTLYQRNLGTTNASMSHWLVSADPYMFRQCVGLEPTAILEANEETNQEILECCNDGQSSSCGEQGPSCMFCYDQIFDDVCSNDPSQVGSLYSRMETSCFFNIGPPRVYQLANAFDLVFEPSCPDAYHRGKVLCQYFKQDGCRLWNKFIKTWQDMSGLQLADIGACLNWIQHSNWTLRALLF